jgi:hypothetical protein
MTITMAMTMTMTTRKAGPQQYWCPRVVVAVGWLAKVLPLVWPRTPMARRLVTVTEAEEQRRLPYPPMNHLASRCYAQDLEAQMEHS